MIVSYVTHVPPKGFHLKGPKPEFGVDCLTGAEHLSTGAVSTEAVRSTAPVLTYNGVCGRVGVQ